MKIAEIIYSAKSKTWCLAMNPNLSLSNFVAAGVVMHPETRRSILEPGDEIDSMMIAALVREGVDELSIQSIYGGPVINCVIEVEYA